MVTKGMFGLRPQATLPKLASQFFGAGFGCPWIAKILARISEGNIKWSIGSQIIGNKPNMQKDIWHDQYFGRVNWGHKPNRPKIYSNTDPDNKYGGRAFMAINILISIIMRPCPPCHTHAEDPVFK
jgi:hypothetical protein